MSGRNVFKIVLKTAFNKSTKPAYLRWAAKRLSFSQPESVASVESIPLD